MKKITAFWLISFVLLQIFSFTGIALHAESTNSINKKVLVENTKAPAKTSAEPVKKTKHKVNAGRTAWMLTSTALVLLMVPGLALFYAGMVRHKNMLNTILLSFICMAVIGVEWVLIGYNMAFGESIAGLVGWSSGGLALGNIPWDEVGANGVPTLVFVMFQGKFAIITPALFSGAIAERVKFSSFIVFALLWSILIYNPLAHMVWAENGWLFKAGVLDFAGGTVVHIASGFSALILATVFLKKRIGYPEDTTVPSSLVLTLLGAGLLWVGWFGFNAGSAIATEDFMLRAALAFGTTQTAAAAAALSWILLEWYKYGKPTALGLASGMVAGLVAITPGAGHLSIAASMLVGLAAGVVCFMAVSMKSKLGYDDTLDVFGIHGIGGLFGALATGALASVGAEASLKQFGLQALGAGFTIVLVIVGTLILGFIVDKLIGFRVEKKFETLGLDMTQHGESANRYH